MPTALESVHPHHVLPEYQYVAGRAESAQAAQHLSGALEWAKVWASSRESIRALEGVKRERHLGVDEEILYNQALWTRDESAKHHKACVEKYKQL